MYIITLQNCFSFLLEKTYNIKENDSRHDYRFLNYTSNIFWQGISSSISHLIQIYIMKRDSKQRQITYREKTLLWKQIAKIFSASLLSSILSSLYVPSFPISTFSNNGLYIYYILYVSLIKNFVNQLTNNDVQTHQNLACYFSGWQSGSWLFK
jgi:hypothetical protein